MQFKSLFLFVLTLKVGAIAAARERLRLPRLRSRISAHFYFNSLFAQLPYQPRLPLDLFIIFYHEWVVLRIS